MHSRVKHPKRNEEKGDRNEEKITSLFAFLLFPLVAFASHAQAETIKGRFHRQHMHRLNLRIQIKPIKELT